MINLLLVLLSDTLKREVVMDGWYKRVGGVNILHSAGLSQDGKHEIMDDMPVISSRSALLDLVKVNNFTLFTAIDDDALLERASQVALDKGKGFTRPEQEIMVVVPVARLGTAIYDRRFSLEPSAIVTRSRLVRSV